MKHVSHAVLTAQRAADTATKTATIRVVAPTHEHEARVTIVIAGKFARPGDLAEVTEWEARDLIARGRAELVEN